MRAANGRLTIKSKAETRQLEYDKLLLGIGRKANVEDLGLAAVNIRVRDGGVEADENLRTSKPERLRRWRCDVPGTVNPRGDGHGALVRSQRP